MKKNHDFIQLDCQGTVLYDNRVAELINQYNGSDDWKSISSVKNPIDRCRIDVSFKLNDTEQVNTLFIIIKIYLVYFLLAYVP